MGKESDGCCVGRTSSTTYLLCQVQEESLGTDTHFYVAEEQPQGNEGRVFRVWMFGVQVRTVIELVAIDIFINPE